MYLVFHFHFRYKNFLILAFLVFIEEEGHCGSALVSLFSPLFSGEKERELFHGSEASSSLILSVTYILVLCLLCSLRKSLSFLLKFNFGYPFILWNVHIVMLLKGEKLLRLIQPRHCRWFLRINRGFMALNKNAVTCFSCFQGFSHLSNASDNHKLISTRHWVNMGTASRPGFETALSVKCSMDHHNALPRKFEDDDRDHDHDHDHELMRAYAAAPYSLLLSDSDVIPRRDLGLKVVNEHGASRHGRPLGFLEHTMPKKMVVDVDEGIFF